MVPFVLPNVLLIAEECTKDEYVRLILPDLTPVFKQQEPIQVDAQRSTVSSSVFAQLDSFLSSEFLFPCFLRLVIW